MPTSTKSIYACRPLLCINIWVKLQLGCRCAALQDDTHQGRHCDVCCCHCLGVWQSPWPGCSTCIPQREICYSVACCLKPSVTFAHSDLSLICSNKPTLKWCLYELQASAIVAVGMVEGAPHVNWSLCCKMTGLWSLGCVSVFLAAAFLNWQGRPLIAWAAYSHTRTSTLLYPIVQCATEVRRVHPSLTLALHNAG